MISDSVVNNSQPYIDISRLGDVKFKVSETDLYHRVEDSEENRIDMISYKYYGSVYLWWIIAIANGILDPLLEIASGDTLRIPDISTVLDELAKRKVG